MPWIGKTCVAVAMLAALLMMPLPMIAAVDECRGYLLVTHKMDPKCKSGEESILFVSEDASLHMNPDCTFDVSGCVQFTKSFEEATIDYKFEFANRTRKFGKYDVCDALDLAHDSYPAFIDFLTRLQLDTSCPVTRGSCSEKGAAKNQTLSFGLALIRLKRVTGGFEITTGDGSKACLDVDLELQKY